MGYSAEVLPDVRVLGDLNLEIAVAEQCADEESELVISLLYESHLRRLALEQALEHRAQVRSQNAPDALTVR